MLRGGGGVVVVVAGGSGCGINVVVDGGGGGCGGEDGRESDAEGERLGVDSCGSIYTGVIDGARETAARSSYFQTLVSSARGVEVPDVPMKIFFTSCQRL